MMICLAISSLSESGKSQRDCLEIGDRLIARGHDVTIMTTRLIGKVSSRAQIEMLPVSAVNNTDRDYKLGEIVFVKKITFDLTVGFNKMVGLDVYYAGESSCSKSKTDWWNKLLPPFRTRQEMEALVFSPGRYTQIIALNQKQADDYAAFWKTERSRIKVIGPILERKQLQPDLWESRERDALSHMSTSPYDDGLGEAVMLMEDWITNRGRIDGDL